jgi:hypothetical protein
MRVILASVAAALAFTAVPATASPDVCAAAPAALRNIAESADQATQRRAVRNIALGEALCDARNRLEAQKKFQAAARTLGTDLAAVMAQTPVASAR